MSDCLMTGRYSNGPPLPSNRAGPPACKGGKLPPGCVTRDGPPTGAAWGRPAQPVCPQAFPSFDGFVDRSLAKRKPQAMEMLPRGDPRNRGRPQSMPRGDPRAGPLEGRLIHDEPPN